MGTAATLIAGLVYYDSTAKTWGTADTKKSGRQMGTADIMTTAQTNGNSRYYDTRERQIGEYQTL